MRFGLSVYYRSEFWNLYKGLFLSFIVGNQLVKRIYLFSFNSNSFIGLNFVVLSLNVYLKKALIVSNVLKLSLLEFIYGHILITSITKL